MKQILLASLALLAASVFSFAQNTVGIPDDVFYLMPSFAPGTLVYEGQAPIRGTFNICAIDNTVRFKDKSGQELEAEDDGSLSVVVIDKVTFVRNDGYFARLYPVGPEVSVAVRRNVLIMNDSKTGAYGLESQTTSVTEWSGLRTTNRYIDLTKEAKELPYRMTETASLFRNGSFLPLTKKNCQKCFPGKKDEIEAWFKEHKNIVATDVPAVLELLRQWVE